MMKKTEMSLKEFHETHKLFYASSIHKMQGSEEDIIVLFISKEHSFMWGKSKDSKNLLYTAISRAKKKCIIIGDEDLFIKSQRKIDKKNNSLFMKLSDDFDLERVSDEDEYEEENKILSKYEELKIRKECEKKIRKEREEKRRKGYQLFDLEFQKNKKNKNSEYKKTLYEKGLVENNNI